MPAGRRQQQRVKLALPVQVTGIDSGGRIFSVRATTSDISPGGARLTGVDVPLNTGDYVKLQYGDVVGRFRIIWVARDATAKDLGVTVLEQRDRIWHDIFPEHREQSKLAAPDHPKLTDRRRYIRIACNFGIELTSDTCTEPTRSPCTDISLGGCYVETWWPFETGVKLRFTISTPLGPLRGEGFVQTSYAHLGMGIRFNTVQPPHLLAELVRELKNRTARKGVFAVGSESLPSSGENVTSPAPCAQSEPIALAPLSRSPRVLVVDDSLFFQKAYSRSLQQEQFEVTTVEDGERALVAAESNPPDLIVLDLLMPRMGGLEALRRLKMNPRTAHIPVVVFSALPPTNEAKLLEAGAAAYGSKSCFGPDDLPAFVQKVLYKQNRPPATHPAPPAFAPS